MEEKLKTWIETFSIQCDFQGENNQKSYAGRNYLKCVGLLVMLFHIKSFIPITNYLRLSSYYCQPEFQIKALNHPVK